MIRYGPEILDHKKTVSLLDKIVYERLFKNCFVCFTHTFSIFDETGRLCSKNDNRSQFSNKNCSTELCVGFQIMITNTLVRCQFNMYLQWEFHIVLCYVFSSIKSTLVSLFKCHKNSVNVETKPWNFDMGKRLFVLQ